MSIQYGTAGWSYKDWFGTVYPENPGNDFNKLGFISEIFDFVEVNTTFYRIPSPSLSEGWINKTHAKPDFGFWIKLNSIFTHKREYNDNNVSDFINSVKPLHEADKLEGVLIQFPYSFKFGIQEMKYLEELFGYFGIFTLAVEFRHRSWKNRELLSFFSDYEVIWVNIDQPVISASLPITDIVTNKKLTYLRLHGRNYNDWFSGSGRDARYNYCYSSKELIEIGELVKKLKKKAQKVFISGNNHYKGNAVKNLLKLKEISESTSG